MVIESDPLHRPLPPSFAGRSLTASIVICAHTIERWGLLKRAIISALAQQPSEVIVVIDYNEELLARVDAELVPLSSGLLRVVANTEAKGLSGARNVGIAMSTTEVVAFLDDDAEAGSGWLAALNAPFVDAAVVSVGGRAEAGDPDRFPSWWPSEFNWVVGCSWTGLPEQLEAVRNVIGCSMAFRRSAVLKAGGFRSDFGRNGENAGGCEETELCIRLRETDPSARVMFEPRALVTHHVDERRFTASYFAKRCFAEGKAKAAISLLSGNSALGPETAFVSSTIRRSLSSSLAGLFRGDLHPVQRAVSVFFGLGVTASGFAVGRVNGLRR